MLLPLVRAGNVGSNKKPGTTTRASGMARQRNGSYTADAMSSFAITAPSPLKADGLVRTFGALTAVAGLSLEVRRGELLALLGPNGAGKTTTMRMLVGLLKPDSGRIEVLGASGRDLRAAQRQQIGYCPQRLIVWRDLTCTEQLVFTARMYQLEHAEGESRAARLLEMFGLAKKRDELAAHLSGGMQRRLSLALAMVHEPEILILDEPAAGLDPQSRVLVRQRIRALSREQNKTILVSTHDMEEADRMADRVAIIDHGELLALDTPEVLKNTHGTKNLVEIALIGHPPRECERARAALSDVFPGVRLSEDVIHIDADDGAELVGPVQEKLTELSIEATEIRVRRRSLEDLFIELTGRSLRE